MPRRVTACFPFSTALALTSRAGQGPVYSGAKSAAALAYMLHSATGLVASVRAQFEGPHAAGYEQGAVAIESATDNEIVSTSADDALQLSDWTSLDGTGTCTVDVTTDYCAGPWGADGPTATLIAKAGDPSQFVFYYSNPVGSPAGDVSYGIYVKVLSGTLRVSSRSSGVHDDVAAGSGWTRVELTDTTPPANYGLELRTTTTGASVTFLACCAQVEDGSKPTSFVNGTRSSTGIVSADPVIVKDIQNCAFSFWVAPAEATPTNPQYILVLSDDGTFTAGHYFAVYRQGSGSNATRVSLATDEITNTGTSFNPVGWSDGAWHHVVVSISAGAATVYIDGASAGAATGTQRAFASVTTLQIGFFTGSSVLNGLLADVLFFDAPLTAAEVAALYVTKPIFGSLDALASTLQPQGEIPITHQGGIVKHTFADGSTARAAFTPISEDQALLTWDGLSYTEAQTLRDLWDANGAGFGPITYTPASVGVAHTYHGVPGTFREVLRNGRAAVTFTMERS